VKRKKWIRKTRAVARLVVQANVYLNSYQTFQKFGYKILFRRRLGKVTLASILWSPKARSLASFYFWVRTVLVFPASRLRINAPVPTYNLVSPRKLPQYAAPWVSPNRCH
jgi:hypothetical protein